MDQWDPQRLAGRLERLDRGSGSVIWTRAAGIVRVDRLSARLWEFTPISGDLDWEWLRVGPADSSDRFWKLSFSDGINDPTNLVDTNLSPHAALWDAAAFLDSDIRYELAANAAESSLDHPATEVEPPAIEPPAVEAAAEPQLGVEPHELAPAPSSEAAGPDVGM
jgi:hypothetical protein